MSIFAGIARLREFEKANLPFIQRLEDVDIVFLVGLHQELHSPLTMREVLCARIGTPSTVTRRIAELRDAGHLIATHDPEDRRRVLLHLSPAVYQTFKRYGELLKEVSAEVSG